MAKAIDLRALSDEDLNAMCQDLKKEVFQMRCAKAFQKEEVKPHQIRGKRKDIARVLTVQSERKAR